MEKQSLKPAISDNIRILILGSMPGEESLRQQRYYAHKGNDFWKLVGNALDVDFAQIEEYDKKIECLNSHAIGLWDVYQHCEREGSLDADISNAEFNDFSVLKEFSDLKVVCFNGKEAGKSESYFRLLKYNTKVLPSSSGANRRNNAQRFAEWKEIIRKYLKN